MPSSDENVLSGESVPDETMTQRVKQLTSENACNEEHYWHYVSVSQLAIKSSSTQSFYTHSIIDFPLT